jgi:hypothetical protein
MAVVDAMKEDATVISSAEQPKSDLYLNDGEKDLDEDFGVPERFKGTADDKREMSMLGKKQVLRVCARHFHAMEIFFDGTDTEY